MKIFQRNSWYFYKRNPRNGTYVKFEKLPYNAHNAFCVTVRILSNTEACYFLYRALLYLKSLNTINKIIKKSRRINIRVLTTSKISGKATNARIVHIQRTKDLFKTRIIYLQSYFEGRDITFATVSRYHCFNTQIEQASKVQGTRVCLRKKEYRLWKKRFTQKAYRLYELDINHCTVSLSSKGKTYIKRRILCLYTSIHKLY